MGRTLLVLMVAVLAACDRPPVPKTGDETQGSGPPPVQVQDEAERAVDKKER